MAGDRPPQASELAARTACVSRIQLDANESPAPKARPKNQPAA